MIEPVAKLQGAARRGAIIFALLRQWVSGGTPLLQLGRGGRGKLEYFYSFRVNYRVTL